MIHLLSKDQVIKTLNGIRSTPRFDWTFNEKERAALNQAIDTLNSTEDLRYPQKSIASVISRDDKLEEDTVNSPSHYTSGGIETIDFIKVKMTGEQFEGYCTGNIIKYISRYKLKNGAEDLKKAAKYLEWMIESVEG